MNLKGRIIRCSIKPACGTIKETNMKPEVIISIFGDFTISMCILNTFCKINYDTCREFFEIKKFRKMNWNLKIWKLKMHSYRIEIYTNIISYPATLLSWFHNGHQRTSTLWNIVEPALQGCDMNFGGVNARQWWGYLSSKKNTLLLPHGRHYYKSGL